MEGESIPDNKVIDGVQQDAKSSALKRSRNQSHENIALPGVTENADNEDEKECSSETVTMSQIQKPIKRARTAYFIFADEKRAEVQSQVRSIIRELKLLWNEKSQLILHNFIHANDYQLGLYTSLST
jgi:hypothetical protein